MMLIDRTHSVSFSYSNGEPQTPTRTPTSAAFGDTAFQTPKLESSFFDPRVTWDTADPYASSPEFLKTPQRFVFGTPSVHNASLPANHGVDTMPGSSFGQHLSPNINFNQAGDIDTARKRRSLNQPANLVEDGPSTVNSARLSAATMQTPPPTSTSRRKVADFDSEAVNPSYTVSANRLSHDFSHQQTPSRLTAASPRLFGNIQNSPDWFQISSMDPSASPFFSQQKLFWEQDPEHQNGGLNLPVTSQDPFTMPTSTSFNAVASSDQNLAVPPLPVLQGSMDLPEFSQDTTPFGLGSNTPADAALFPAPFSTSPRVPMTKAEDPALFLSSPARRFGPPPTGPVTRDIPARDPPRQPYHHQTEELKREQLRRAQNPNASLSTSFSESEEDDDDFTPRARLTRPGLTRSQTTTAVSAQLRPQSQQSSSGPLASTSGIKKPQSRGRSSPVKTMRQPLSRRNSTNLPGRSQPLVLKIDKDGRAKTEFLAAVTTGLTDPLSEMDLDGSATESESDSAEYSEYPIAHSQRSSFILPAQQPPPAMLNRNGSVSSTLCRPHSKSSSYSSTAASSNSGRRSPWGEPPSRGGLKRSQTTVMAHDWSQTPRRSSVPVSADFSRGTATSSTDTLPDPDDAGDAQHALRQVLKGKNRGSRQALSGYGTVRGPSAQTLAHLRSSPPGMSSRFDRNSSDSNASPTTITDPEVATPSTDRYSNPSNGTRCICKSMDNGGHLMIQWFVYHLLPLLGYLSL